MRIYTFATTSTLFSVFICKLYTRDDKNYKIWSLIKIFSFMFDSLFEDIYKATSARALITQQNAYKFDNIADILSKSFYTTMLSLSEG